MNWKEKDGLLIPKEKREPKPTGTYVLTYYYAADHIKVRESLENQGARICGVLTVPFWNIYGQITGNQHAVIYQATEELGCEVLT